MIKFDGRKVRDEILTGLKDKVGSLSYVPAISVIWIGEDKVSARYIEQKQRAAEFLGVHFDIIKFALSVPEDVVVKKIQELNADDSVKGVVVQLPLPQTISQKRIISEIDPMKDIDALRFCNDLECTFRPPVTAAILRAVSESGADLMDKKVAVIGRGFLVGSPLIRILKAKNVDLRIADENTPYLGTVTADTDVVISAVGKPGLIKPNLIKSGAVLIDAGTTEIGGKLAGDVDPHAYEKSSFYTPVPGGIGPVTVAMLFQNLIQKL